MRHSELSALITKCAGLILIVFSLAAFPYRFAEFAQSYENLAPYMFFGLVLPLLVPLCAGAFLFWLPATVSDKLVSEKESKGFGELAQTLRSVLFSILGVYFAISATLDLAFYAVMSGFHDDYTGSYLFEDPEARAGRIVAVIELVLAVLLIVGAKRLSRIFRGFAGR